MSEFKGTKGEWELIESDFFSEIISKKPSSKSICAINMNIDEHKSNAKLIACAPEMLEMLEYLNSFCTMNTEDRKKLELLIKKAKS